jgi:hypothetical protein
VEPEYCGVSDVKIPTCLGDSDILTAPGLPEFGTIKVKCLYDPNDAGHTAIIGYAEAGTEIYWKITYSDTSTETAKGFVVGSPKIGGLEVDGYATLEFSVKLVEHFA